MNKCVECGDWLKSPRQLPLCEECFQQMLKESIEDEENEGKN